MQRGRARGCFDVNTPDGQGFTPLALAVRSRNVGVVKGLLRAGAQPSLASTAGQLTPLHFATMLTACDELVSVLLKAGADPDAASADGTTPVHVAALNGNTAVLDMLLGPLGHGDPNGQRVGSGGSTPLYAAAFLGHVDTAAALIRHGALIDMYKVGV